MSIIFVMQGKCLFSDISRPVSVFIHEPMSSKNTPVEVSDQPAHPHSLIRVFNGRLMGSQRSNVSSCINKVGNQVFFCVAMCGQVFSLHN